MRTIRFIIRRILWVVVLIGLCQGPLGCGDRARLPSAEKLAAFQNAGPNGPVVDMDRIVQATVVKGPYRVQVNDVLELRLPTFLYSDVPQRGPGEISTSVQLCRVSDSGTITLPDGRLIQAAGRPLTQIESDIVQSYYPELVTTRPSVYVQAVEYAKSRVRIMGAVRNPGLYELRYDQMSLVGLLMEAGGIVQEGAAVIKIVQGQAGDASRADGPDAMLSQADDTPWHRTASGSGISGTVPRHGLLAADVYLCFEREGPLETTGWLSVRSAGETTFRQWLDVGSARQRWDALEKIDTIVKVKAMAEANLKLSSLARLLTTRPPGSRVHLAAYEAGGSWSQGGGDVFVTSLDVTEQQRQIDSSSALPEPGAASETAVVLPVKGMNIPFTDVALREGDSVIVERPEVQYVSVLGLVRSPGNFPYPANTEFTLGEALAFAGGLDLVADPRYVCVYRLQADGTVASATFRLIDPRKAEQFTEALALKLKRGDVVAVENTPRTRTNTFFDRVFRISLGLYLNPDTIWNN